jgi:hypothetical protein
MDLGTKVCWRAPIEGHGTLEARSDTPQERRLERDLLSLRQADPAGQCLARQRELVLVKFHFAGRGGKRLPSHSQQRLCPGSGCQLENTILPARDKGKMHWRSVYKYTEQTSAGHRRRWQWTRQLIVACVAKWTVCRCSAEKAGL